MGYHEVLERGHASILSATGKSSDEQYGGQDALDLTTLLCWHGSSESVTVVNPIIEFKRASAASATGSQEPHQSQHT